MVQVSRTEHESRPAQQRLRSPADDSGRRSKSWQALLQPGQQQLVPRIAAAWAPRFKDGALGHIFGEGKTVIRGGYSLVYDRMGMGLVNTFDDEGAFGLASTINSPNGGCNIGATGGRPACLRYTGIFDTAAFDSNLVLQGSNLIPQLAPSPGASFPSTPP